MNSNTRKFKYLYPIFLSLRFAKPKKQPNVCSIAINEKTRVASGRLLNVFLIKFLTGLTPKENAEAINGKFLFAHKQNLNKIAFKFISNFVKITVPQVKKSWGHLFEQHFKNFYEFRVKDLSYWKVLLSSELNLTNSSDVEFLDKGITKKSLVGISFNPKK